MILPHTFKYEFQVNCIQTGKGIKDRALVTEMRKL